MKTVKVNNFFRFIDSCLHLPGSLAQLSADLAADANHNFSLVKQSAILLQKNDIDRPLRDTNMQCFASIRRTLPDPDERLTRVYSINDTKINYVEKEDDVFIDDNVYKNRLDVITRGKAFFPYEYCTDFASLTNCKKIPARSAFYSQLHETSLNHDDYTLACYAWETFNCMSLLEYSCVYNLIDVLLLAEVFEQYKRTMYTFVGMDPSWFITGASFNYQAMLRKTNIKIEQLTDKKMLDLICENLRGGLSYVSSRVEEASSTPDDNGYVRRILYLDANNLYGTCQSLKLPVNNFHWLSASTIHNTDWTTLSQRWTGDEDIGYFILCDLEYPKHLHESHEEFPLCVEKRQITTSDLSPESLEMLYFCEGKTSFKESKLTATFYPRQRHLMHYMCLQTYIRLGLKLIKVREVISFHQEAFMKPFIDECTKKRQKSRTKLESAFYKRMVNSLYGSHILNKHNYLQLFVCKSANDVGRYVALPQFHSAKILNENMIFSFVKHPFVLLDRAYSIGFTVLEQSKNIVAKTFYDHLNVHFKNVRIVTSDTDSIFFSYDSKNPTQDDDLKKIAYMMDFSNYEKNHPLYNTKHKNALFFWKNELSSTHTVKRVCALRSKCYSFESVPVVSATKFSTVQKVVCKGVPKTGRQRLTIDNYMECISNNVQIMSSFQSIRHNNFQLSTMHLRKIALSAFDCKRYMLSCSKHSRPYGSALIKKFGTKCFLCSKNKDSNNKKRTENDLCM